MRIMNTLTTAATIAVFATSTMAGGLADEIMEAPVEVVDVMEPKGSSVNPTFIVLGVLGALLIAAALQEDDEDEPDEPTVIVVTDR